MYVEGKVYVGLQNVGEGQKQPLVFSQGAESFPILFCFVLGFLETRSLTDLELLY